MNTVKLYYSFNSTKGTRLVLADYFFSTKLSKDLEQNLALGLTHTSCVLVIFIIRKGTGIAQQNVPFESKIQKKINTLPYNPLARNIKCLTLSKYKLFQEMQYWDRQTWVLLKSQYQKCFLLSFDQILRNNSKFNLNIYSQENKKYSENVFYTNTILLNIGSGGSGINSRVQNIILYLFF